MKKDQLFQSIKNNNKDEFSSFIDNIELNLLTSNNNYIINVAIEKSDLFIIKELLKTIKKELKNNKEEKMKLFNHIIYYATENKRLDIVKLCLNEDFINNKYNKNHLNKVFYNSVLYQDLELVTFLLKNEIIEPQHITNHSLFCSINSFSNKISKLLIMDSRVKEKITIKELNSAYSIQNHDIVRLLWDIKHVKSELKEKDFEFYKELLKYDIEKKIKGF